MKKVLLATSFFVSSAFFVAAQVSSSNNITVTTSGSNVNGLTQLLALAQTIVSRLVPFLVGVAVLAFFWFLIQFIWKGSEDPEKQKSSLKGMGMSILALFVMVSIWGIIKFMGNIVGIKQGGSMPAFKLPGQK